jgi:heme exporter protein D
MSYQNYVIAAYAIFAVVLAWDFIAARLRIAQLLRAAKRQAARKQASATPADTELQR